MQDIAHLREMAGTYGQGHLFQFWDELDARARASLLGDLRSIDFALMEHLVEIWLRKPPPPEHFARVEPIPMIPPVVGRDDADAREALAAGEDSIRKGEVGVFLVAGGQGTRLGFSGPKGAYPIGPITGKTLFDYHAEKIRSIQNRYNIELPCYIMVSRENAEATQAYFSSNAWLGLKPDQVIFMEQRLMPCVDAEGKILFSEKGVVAMNPNGHGGSFTAFVDSGAAADAQSRGIRHLCYFQVDNWTAKIVDPYFVGYHVRHNAQMSSKVHIKNNPREPVGVHCLCDGQYRIVEYSELDLYPQLLDCDEAGKPILCAGNPAMHTISVEFMLERAEDFENFPWHVAHKKIPHINSNGEQVNPGEPNGYKFEAFIFDALRHTQHPPVALAIHREGEYTPIKDFNGPNSVCAARKYRSEWWGEWLEKAGTSVPRDEAGSVSINIEISPLFADNLEEFLEKAPPLPTQICGHLAIGPDGSFESPSKIKPEQL